MEEKIKDIVENFFTKLWIDFSNLEVKQELENIFYIKIESSDSPLLIWSRGKTLDDIKNILKIMINKNFEENKIIHIEINDYLKTKEDKLINYIKSKIEIVENTWKDFKLPFFTAYERKKIHSYVASLKSNIYTKSEWEWKDRRLFICKKASKISIDFDWVDI